MKSEWQKNPQISTLCIIFLKAKTGSLEDRLDMWRNRYADSKWGWHKLNVNEHLLKYFDLLRNGKDKLKILFPLCGKSLDLVHCYNEGHTVVGIEGVPMAVEELFKNGGLKFERNFCQAIDGFIYKVRKIIIQL